MSCLREITDKAETDLTTGVAQHAILKALKTLSGDNLKYVFGALR